MRDGEFGRHWGKVLAACVGVMASAITLVNYSIGVFVVPITREFGWSRQDVLTGSAAVTSGALVTSFLVGWLADSIDLRRLIIVSQVLFGLAFCALGLLVHDRTTCFAIYLAMALLAGLVVPPYASWFVETYGWRAGYVAVGALPALVAMPLAFVFLRNLRLERAGVAPGSGAPLPEPYGFTLQQALRSWHFWVIGLALLLASGVATGMSTNFVPLLIDRGFAASSSSAASAHSSSVVTLGGIVTAAACGALAACVRTLRSTCRRCTRPSCSEIVVSTPSGAADTV